MPVGKFLEGLPVNYDLIFCDPPYDYPEMHEMIDSILGGGWLKDDGWFVLEHDARHNFAAHPHCVFTKPYGRTIVAIFLAHPLYGDSSSEDA